MNLLLLFLFSVPFREGEEILFSVKYGLVSAGEMVLKVEGIENMRGYDTYHFSLYAYTKGVFSSFFRINDEIHSYVDKESFSTIFYKKHIEEGDFRQDLEIEYHPESAKVFYPDSKTVDVRERILDPLSLYYFIRNQDIKPGDTLVVKYIDDKELKDMKIVIEREERLDTRIGYKRCLLVVPILEKKGVVEEETALKIWITNDSKKIPVRIDSKLSFGSIHAYILYYYPGERR